MRWPGIAFAPCNAECAGPLCSLTHHPAASQTGRAFTPACRCAGSSPCPAWHQMCAESKSARLRQQKQKARLPRQRGCCVLTAVMRAGHGTMVPTLTLPMGQSKAGAQCYRRCHAGMHQAPAAPHRSQTAHLVLRVGPMCSFDCDKSEQAAPVVVSQQLSLFKGGEQTFQSVGSGTNRWRAANGQASLCSITEATAMKLKELHALMQVWNPREPACPTETHRLCNDCGWAAPAGCCCSGHQAVSQPKAGAGTVPHRAALSITHAVLGALCSRPARTQRGTWLVTCSCMQPVLLC